MEFLCQQSKEGPNSIMKNSHSTGCNYLITRLGALKGLWFLGRLEMFRSVLHVKTRVMLTYLMIYTYLQFSGM